MDGFMDDQITTKAKLPEYTERIYIVTTFIHTVSLKFRALYCSILVLTGVLAHQRQIPSTQRQDYSNYACLVILILLDLFGCSSGLRDILLINNLM